MSPNPFAGDRLRPIDITEVAAYHRKHSAALLRTTGTWLLIEGVPLIKQDLIQQIVDRTGLPRNKAEAAIDAVLGAMKGALAQGDRIELRGFGVFTVRPRKTGVGRNPRTGTKVDIAPGRAVRFKPGKELQCLEGPAGTPARP